MTGNPRAILKTHPIPWQSVVGNHGQVHVVAANGLEVPMFPMLEYLVQLTHEEAGAKDRGKSTSAG